MLSNSGGRSSSLFSSRPQASNKSILTSVEKDKIKRKRKAKQIIEAYDDKEPTQKTAKEAKTTKKKPNRNFSFEYEMSPSKYLNDEQSDTFLVNSDPNSDQEINPYVGKEGTVTKPQKKEENRRSYELGVGGRSSRASDESGSEHDKDSGEEEDGDVDKEYAALKEELSSFSFEELLKVKETMGLKVFNQVMYGSKMKSAVSKTSKPNKKFKRENKNRPMEMSSKVHVPRIRQIMPVKKKIARDPRFDDLSGQYNETFFKKAYSFLDHMKAKEKEKVEVLLKKETDGEKKKNMKALLNRMNQQEQTMLQKKKQTELLTEWKRKEEERVKEGKIPYFLKKSDKKKLVLAEKYKELKKSGKVEKYLNKKRKKNAQKDRKKLPGRFEH